MAFNSPRDCHRVRLLTCAAEWERQYFHGACASNVRLVPSVAVAVSASLGTHFLERFNPGVKERVNTKSENMSNSPHHI